MGMHEHAHKSRLTFEHLLPGLAEAGIARGHDNAIRQQGQLGPLPGQRQRTEHGGTSHQLSGRQAVIEEAKHRITVGADGIGHGAAMAAGAKDQPAMGRGMGICHQLWDATAKGTATR